MGEKLNGFALVVIFLLFIGFSSSLGCCVNSKQEVCSTNSEKTSCEQFGGIFYNNDPSCAAQRVCDSGCCILGLDSARTTRGKCQTETEDRGFAAINFMQTAEDCGKYITSQEWGACITLNSYGKKSCSFSTRTQCAGEFFNDVLCTEVKNSNCNKTEDRVCVGNQIYLVDSCGNRDSLAEECDYSSGSVCKQTSDNGKNSAECITANCEDDFDYTPFIIDSLYENVPVYNPIERKQGEVWCVTNGMVPFNEEELDRNFNIFGDTISGTAGLRFFSRSCVNGQIITEPCEDGKESYCSGESDWENPNSVVGTGGRCVSNEWRGCLSAENEDDCDGNYCFWFTPEEIVSKTSVKMLKDLKLGKCLPKISGGATDGASASTICSQGDYETTFAFTKSTKLLTKKSNTRFGNTGFLLGGESSWEIRSTTSLAAGELNLYLDGGMASLVSKGKLPFIILNPEAVALLEYRCSKIADCTGKMNWVGEYGRNSSNGVDFMTAEEIQQEFIARDISLDKKEQALLNSYLRSTGLEDIELANYPKDKFPILFGSAAKKTLDMTFEYTCVPRKPSLSGECSKCSEDGNVCSEYVCGSLGTNCEYVSASGTCENKGDVVSPTITINCPNSSLVGIQQPVKISVNTSEVSECKFSLENAGAIYDSMQYDLGSTWSKNHETTLTVEGLNQAIAKDATQYSLLRKSGLYNVFVRCIDPKRNGDIEPAKLCTFEIPKTPDKNPPVVLKFTPKADTPVLFNSTIQEITMLVNEPVECKWSLKDQDYDLMTESFDCRRDLVFRNDISGYECMAELTNITRNLGNSTKFYIRCDDQPELEGEETEVYSRNKNIQSTVYSLKPSVKLEIVELSPKNKVTLGPNFANWNLTVKTQGGGYNGITECKWRLNYRNYSTAYSSFSTIQSTFKTQSINQNVEGDYLLSVVCADDSGNTANYSGPLAIRYDRTAPFITRVYNDKGNLKITTNEPAICKYTSILGLGFGCAFTISSPNLTTMVDFTNTEHNTNWKKGASYFVKCQDFYGNENSICGTIAKAI